MKFMNENHNQAIENMKYYYTEVVNVVIYGFCCHLETIFLYQFLVYVNLMHMTIVLAISAQNEGLLGDSETIKINKIMKIKSW